MERQCEATRESLAEHRGRVDRLPPVLAAHLRECDGCGAVAKDESRLEALLAAAVPPEDRELAATIVHACRSERRWSRIWTWTPVAASLLVMTAGAVLAGGVPGGRFVTDLPRLAVHGIGAVAAQVGDWVTVWATLTAAAPDLISAGTAGAAALATVTGGAACVAVARRWAVIRAS